MGLTSRLWTLDRAAGPRHTRAPENPAFPLHGEHLGTELLEVRLDAASADYLSGVRRDLDDVLDHHLGDRVRLDALVQQAENLSVVHHCSFLWGDLVRAEWAFFSACSSSFNAASR